MSSKNSNTFNFLQFVSINVQFFWICSEIDWIHRRTGTTARNYINRLSVHNNHKISTKDNFLQHCIVGIGYFITHLYTILNKFFYFTIPKHPIHQNLEVLKCIFSHVTLLYMLHQKINLYKMCKRLGLVSQMKVWLMFYSDIDSDSSSFTSKSWSSGTTKTEK